MRGFSWSHDPETRKILRVGLLVLGVVAVAVIGYMLIGGLSFFDALYTAVIVLSTVGLASTTPLTHAGEVFTVLLIIAGVTLIAYGVGSFIEYVVSGHVTGLYRRRAVRKRIAQLEGHFIVCGYGRVGQAVIKEFALSRAPFVVVDSSPEAVAQIEADGFLAVTGNASADEVLEAAGISRARGLVAAVGSDADNIYVTLTARVLNPGLLIVARASTDETVSKLRRAGADQVISPYAIGGKKMATLLLTPLVSDYLDVVTGQGELEFRLEEFALNDTCEVVGRSIRELEIRRDTGATILAVRRGDSGVFDTNPDPSIVLNDSDMLIAIGTPAEIAKLEEMFACRLPASRKDSYGVVDQARSD
jgi:voltage-gated potassium channel